MQCSLTHTSVLFVVVWITFKCGSQLQMMSKKMKPIIDRGGYDHDTEDNFDDNFYDKRISTYSHYFLLIYTVTQI